MLNTLVFIQKIRITRPTIKKQVIQYKESLYSHIKWRKSWDRLISIHRIRLLRRRRRHIETMPKITEISKTGLFENYRWPVDFPHKERVIESVFMSSSRHCLSWTAVELHPTIKPWMLSLIHANVFMRLTCVLGWGWLWVRGHLCHDPSPTSSSDCLHNPASRHQRENRSHAECIQSKKKTNTQMPPKLSYVLKERVMRSCRGKQTKSCPSVIWRK